MNWKTSSTSTEKNHGPDQKFCKRNIDFAIEYLYDRAFVCTIVIDSFCMQYCKCQLFQALLEFKTTVVCTAVIENALWSNIAIDILSCTIIVIDFCMYYCNWQI